jgi:ATP-dependent Clp protease ATP-binding subunit ClpB
LRERDINLVISETAFNHIAEVGYDPYFGARPVKRVIQREVLNELSKALLAKKVDTSTNVVMDMFDDKIIFRKPVTETEEK